MSAPAVGTFLHQPGTCYAIEVVRVSPPAPNHHPRLPRIQGRRWGFKDGRPFNDGFRGDHSMELRYRGPGYWTQPDYWNRMPSVWREVPPPAGEARQTDLFGATA